MRDTVYLTIRVPRALLKAFQVACASGRISVNPGECKPVAVSELLRRRMREHLGYFLAGRRTKRRRSAAAEAQALINRVVLPPPGVVDLTVDEDDDPLVEAGFLVGTGEGWRRGRDSVALTIRVERELAEAFKRICAERGKCVSRVLRDVMRRIVGAKLLVEEARTMQGISKKSPLGRRLRALQKREIKLREARYEGERVRLEREAYEEWKRLRY